MGEQSGITYLDGDIVWVKLGSCWWPGEVCGLEKLPPGLLKSFRKTPIAVVKFFQEESYEYVKNFNWIYKYDCSRKNDFIKKGLDLFRSKHTHMDKFPEDVCTAERKTDGDPDIITRDEFLPKKKESYANIFGSPADTTPKRNSLGKRGRRPASSKSPKSPNSASKITHPRILQKYLRGSSDYKAHILVQSTSDQNSPSSPKSIDSEITQTPATESVKTPQIISPGTYTCKECSFITTRLNVMILHNKSHSSSFIPYTPVKNIKTKSPIVKSKPKSVSFPEVEEDDEFEEASTSKKRKVTIKGEGKPRGRSKNILENCNPDETTPIKPQNQDNNVILPPKRKIAKQKERELKKAKTDVEIKNTLLADWNEDSDDEMDVLTSLKLTQNVSEPSAENELEENINSSVTNKPQESDVNSEKVSTNICQKVEKRDQVSCFDFEEDEDLQIENLGKKIPRLSSKSEDKKIVDLIPNTSADTDKVTNSENVNALGKTDVDLDSEIDNLLNETTVPDLPAIPSNSNFQKGKIVKVPDKGTDPPPLGKSIFKTKTFFRSRHSRSQDAIEKYVADNTSTDKPITYMNEPVESERTSDIISETLNDNSSLSQDIDILPPKTETVRVTKYAPKIQLKKLNAANAVKNKVLATQQELSAIKKNEFIATDEKVKKSESDLKDCEVGELKSPELPISSPKHVATCDRVSKKDIINGDRAQISSVKSPLPEIHVLTENQEKEKNIVQQQDSSLTISKTTLISGDLSGNVTESQLAAPNNPPYDHKLTEKDNSINIGDSNKEPSVTDSSDKSILYRILDEGAQPQKTKPPLKIISSKMMKPVGREKILNFELDAGPDVKPKLSTSHPQRQKIIIRRATNLLKPKSQENNQLKGDSSDTTLIICNKNAEKWIEKSVHSSVIEEATSSQKEFLDPKFKKVTQYGIQNFASKPHNTIITSTGEIIQSDKSINQDVLFDINSMPIVLSDEIVTGKSESNTINNKNSSSTSDPRLFSEVVPETSVKPHSEPLKKSIIVKSIIEKSVSPNILSKSPKGKNTKHLLIVDKKTGEKKIIKTVDDHEEFIKKITNATGHVAPEKIIINSTLSSGKKTQKVIISPSAKNQAVLGRLNESSETELRTSNSPIPKTSVTKTIQSKSNVEKSTGNAIMILTNAKTGVQSKIVITPEQKLLFPKGKTHVSVTPQTKNQSSIVITSAQALNSDSTSTSNSGKPNIQVQSNKQKTTLLNNRKIIVGSGNKRTILTTMPGQAILTSKGQLISSQSSNMPSSNKIINSTKPHVSTTTQLMKHVSPQTVVGKPRQEIIVSKTEKPDSSTILLKSPSPRNTQGQVQKDKLWGHKPGTVMHLTAAQFEHLQKTGQLISSVQKGNSSQTKSVSGKVTQKFILQKVVNSKQSEVSPEKNVQKSESVYSNKVPPLTPIHTEVKDKKSKEQPSQMKQTQEPDCTISDADDLIPASIIPTRKHEMLQKKLIEKPKKNTEAPTPVTEPTKLSAEDQISANTLNDPQKQLLAVPGENFGGPINSFFLCVEENGTLTPIDNQPLVLENNQLVPMNILIPPETVVGSSKDQISEMPMDQTQQNILLNIGDQQILIDHHTLVSLLAGEGEQLITNDGQQIVFQGNSQQILAALANNPEFANLLSGGQQIILNSGGDVAQQSEERQIIQPSVNQDILAAALAGTEVFQQEALMSESITTTDSDRMIMEIDSLNPNIHQNPPVHSNVFETSSTLNQPIMSPLEIPTKKRTDEKISTNSQVKNLDDSLAVIGVTTPNIPTSLELPITVTNPRIAAKTTSPLSLTSTGIYQTSSMLNTVLPTGLYEPEKLLGLTEVFKKNVIEDAEAPFTKDLETINQASVDTPIASSMPCLDDESTEGVTEQGSNDVEKKTYSPISMPILTDDGVDLQMTDEVHKDAPETQNVISMPILSETSDTQSKEQVSEIIEETPQIEKQTVEAVKELESKTEIEDEKMDVIKIEEKQIETISEEVTSELPENIETEKETSLETESEDSPPEDPMETADIDAVISVESTETNDTVKEINGDSDKPEDIDMTEAVAPEDTKDETPALSEVNITAEDDSPQNVESSKIINNADSIADEICVDTPPPANEDDSAADYQEDVNMLITHNEADGNSLPDNTCDEVNISCSSEAAALPDSTSPNLDVAPPTPEDVFSDSSSNASIEIPMQPTISVSHSIVQNFSSLLNNTEERLNENEDSNATDGVEQFECKENSPKAINDR